MDGTTFRTSPGLSFVVRLVIGYVSWLLVQVVLSVAFGRWPDVIPLLLPGLIFASAFAGLWHFFERRSRSSVRVTDEGLTLTEKQRVAVIPWTAVRSATIRRPWPFSVLEVTVHPAGAASWASAMQPLIRDGVPVYTVNVGLLRPGPAALRAAVDNALASRPGGASATG
jgi:hypothetical protein